MHYRSAMTASIALLTASLPLHAQSPFHDSYRFIPDDAVRDTYELDLKYVGKAFEEVNESFTYTPGSQASFSREIDQLIHNAGSLTFGDFVMGISRAVAQVDNGHTSIITDGYLRHFPIRVSWFGDQLHVIRTRNEHIDLLGAKVLTIAGKSPNELLQLLESYIGGTAEHVKAVSPDYLDSPDALDGIGVVDDAGTVEVSFERRDGTISRVSLPPMKSAEPSLYLAAWRDRVADTDYRENSGWSHLLDDADDVPVYLRDGSNLAALVELPGHGDIYYLRLRLAMDADRFSEDYLGLKPTVSRPPLRSYLLGTLTRSAVKRPYRHAVIDLRFNPGGNYMDIMEFARALPRLLPDDGRIFVLTNNNTFSAAIVTVAFLKASGGDRTVIVGERVGDRENFWAESALLTLPVSGIRVLATQGYHDWANGCAKLPECGFNTLYDVAAGSLSPDIPVTVTFEDYAGGRDPMLLAVLRALDR